MQLFNKSNALKHKGTVNLETDRFNLRQFNINDVNDVYYNWASLENCAKYNATNVLKNEEEAKEVVSNWLLSYISKRYYHWAIVDKDNDEVIGSISASNFSEYQKKCEVGYTIAFKRWNEGIATEVLKRIIEFLTEEININKIIAMHDFRNKASGAVMQKCGMILVKKKYQIIFNDHILLMYVCVYEYNKININ